VHSCNSSTQESEAGGSLVQGEPELLSPKQSKESGINCLLSINVIIALSCKTFHLKLIPFHSVPSTFASIQQTHIDPGPELERQDVGLAALREINDCENWEGNKFNRIYLLVAMPSHVLCAPFSWDSVSITGILTPAYLQCSSFHDTCVFKLFLCYVVVHTYNPSILEAEAGRS
jgi:hypothetical protein